MVIYPAIDLRAGRVVRLDQGDYARETRYSDDPLGVARGFAREGATWLHVVDLDAAREGRFLHLDLVSSLAADSGLRVQCGGGVRHLADVEGLFDAGVSRVVVGSVAVAQPERVLDWIARFGSERVCVALDTRADAQGVFRLPVKGWTETTELGLFDLVDRYAREGDLRHLLCTDIARDGMLVGPNLELYRALTARHPRVQVQVSGGVRDSADAVAARAMGAGGLIVGKALLTGRVTLTELLEC